ncbi:MAG: response regulator [Epsilonproteobacteria bacterium]|nr:MAG: response regulator [Campylobacterota bacterium]
MAKIAIVDDENDILDVLHKFLSRSGDLHIDTFSNPVSGLEKVQNGNYDLVLLDIMMPQLNGLDFLKKLKETNPDINVIMMTAYTTLEKTIEAHKYGAKNYLTKPFTNLKEVKEKIDKALR